jgi:hypothetical protein
VLHDESMTSELVLPDPWWDLRGGGELEQQQRDALTGELATEYSDTPRRRRRGMAKPARARRSPLLGRSPLIEVGTAGTTP